MCWKSVNNGALSSPSQCVESGSGESLLAALLALRLLSTVIWLGVLSSALRRPISPTIQQISTIRGVRAKSQSQIYPSLVALNRVFLSSKIYCYLSRIPWLTTSALTADAFVCWPTRASARQPLLILCLKLVINSPLNTKHSAELLIKCKNTRINRGSSFAILLRNRSHLIIHAKRISPPRTLHAPIQL